MTATETTDATPSQRRLTALPGSFLLPPRLMSAAQAAARYVTEEDAPTTRRMWAIHWKAWGAFCEEASIPVLPVRPLDLITHLTDRSASGAAPNTVRAALTAISVIDQRARATPEDPDPAPVRSEFIVRKWLRGWNRDNPRRPMRQAPAITTSQLDLVLRHAQERPRCVSASHHVASYARDRAMLLIGIAGALRIAELIALDVSDVSIVDRGLVMLVRRSKADQAGEGRKVGIVPQQRLLRCPVDAWAMWLGIRGRWDGPAFVGIDRTGELAQVRLAHSAARSIISRRAKAAGLQLVSSHSMRSTFATLGREQGKPDDKLMAQGGWATSKAFAGYARQGDLFRDNPTQGLLDDG